MLSINLYNSCYKNPKNVFHFFLNFSDKYLSFLLKYFCHQLNEKKYNKNMFAQGAETLSMMTLSLPTIRTMNTILISLMSTAQ